MKTKMLITLFALVSVAGTSEATGTLAAQQNTSIIPTYTLWCMENPYAYFRRVISSLKWACKNGADCSPLEKGGRCQDLDNYRSQASYAFNDYYQKNPIPRNCDFNGAAVLTVQDPSTPTCKFPSNSTGPYPLTSSVTRTATPSLRSFFWGFVFTYLAYSAAQIA
ncbi:unnamed protein product [Arabidopsis thaliana]|uniref:X8 domain-containing protein n=1 Tax=Arabidopsis thaliana TaxID=3702 RepID=A0A5S9X6R3_ARATH|nr:unnamed protein product [Arabidopsis thaliana]VYS55344.1 unnamed protein product [Arabidopsis thaliana]